MGSIDYRPSSSWQDLAGHLLAYPFPRRLVPRLKEDGVVRIRVRVDKVTRNPEARVSFWNCF
jgi:hypothetical protein